MRAIIQRVSRASVSVQKKELGKIKTGLLVLLGIEHSDNQTDIEWLCSKIINMRIFEDESKKMNLSLSDIDGQILIVSQFTLHASTKKGNRPSFIKAAKPDVALALYQSFLSSMKVALNKDIECGEFGAMMDVSLTNDGPVTIFIDSKAKE